MAAGLGIVGVGLAVALAGCGGGSSGTAAGSTSAPASSTAATTATTGTASSTTAAATTAAGPWNGTCAALLGRADWYQLTAAKGKVSCSDPSGQVDVGASMTCTGRVLVDFAGAYWGVKGEALHAGQIPASEYAGCGA